MELGQLYRSTAVIGAGPELPAARRPDEWQGQPGTRAPHFPIEKDGSEVSFLDLLQRGWLLVAANEAWRGIVQELAANGLIIQAAIIGVEIIPKTGTDVSTHFGIGMAGASLIRPDGYIAWRTGEDGTAEMLIDALTKVSAAAHVNLLLGGAL